MIKLKIMTPDQGVCFESEVKYVDVNTTTGHIGLMPNITPMVASLINSNCIIKLNDQEFIDVLICGGTLYVDKEKGIQIFTSAFSFKKDIDIDKLKNKIVLLEDKISNLSESHKEFVDIQNELIISKKLFEAFETK